MVGEEKMELSLTSRASLPSGVSVLLGDCGQET